MSGTLPTVTVVVLNWNNLPDTIECLESLLAVTYPALRLLVVDNGSTDGSEAALRARFPGLELLQTGANLGFAGGNNAGMRHAFEHGADYVLLLNNDTTVDPGFVTALVDAARDHPRAGLLSSKILFFDRPNVIWYAGASFHPWPGWGRHRGYGQRDMAQFDRVEETDRPTGCSLLATRACCERVGLLRDEYFCYAEDLEWGLRARARGFQVLYVPESRVWHKVSRSTGGARSTAAVRYQTRNLLDCVDTHLPLPMPFRVLRWAAILIAAGLGLFTQGIAVRKGASAIFQGGSDYFRGRWGPIPRD
jgi:GT2 family glycosyltransferase